MNPNPTSKRARTAAALDYLARRFPAAFGTDAAALAPLAVGIRDSLAARIATDPAADAPAVLWALRRWCLSRAYVAAVAAGRPRVNLDGQPVEAPAAEHQAQACARLEAEGSATAARAERRRKAEQVQAKAQAKAQEQAAARARQRAAAKATGKPAPATSRPAAVAPAAPPAAAAVVTRARAGRLTKPAPDQSPPAAPAPGTTGAPSPRPVLGLGKRPKPAG